MLIASYAVFSNPESFKKISLRKERIKLKMPISMASTEIHVPTFPLFSCELKHLQMIMMEGPTKIIKKLSDVCNFIWDCGFDNKV